MPILDQGYQHWDGKLAGHALRWLAITRSGVTTQFKKNRWLRSTLLTALFPALLLGGALALWGLFEQKSTILEALGPFLRNLPQELQEGPKGFRTTFWTLAYRVFLGVQLFFAMILVLIVGPDLISQDLRFNALPLYLSRPLRRIDYFLGKFGVIATFTLGVTLLPALLAYVVGLSFSLDPTVLKDTWRVLASAVAFCLVITVSAGLLMLAFSSLSRNSRNVSAMWIGLWMLTGAAAGSLQRSSIKEWAPLISYSQNLEDVRDAMLDTQTHWDRLSSLFRSGRDAVASVPFGPRRRRGGIFAPPRPSVSPDGTVQEKPSVWYSAAVLGGLALVSIAVLSTKVKSLDRLK